MTRGARRCLWAASSGVVLALAMPGPGWWPLVLLFPGLFLESLRGLDGWRGAVFVGWFAGMLHWMVTAHWVVDVLAGYGGLPGAAAWGSLVLMGLILGTTWAATAAVTVLAPGARRVWLFPAAFMVFEVLRRFGPFLFPWNTVAAVLTPVPATLASVSLWGSTGLGWALTAVGAGLWALIRTETRRTGAIWTGVALGSLILATAVAPQGKADGPELTVAVVQPGTTLEERWNPDDWQETADRVWRLSDRAAEHDPDLLLWPESAMPYRIDTDPGYRLGVHRLAERIDAFVVLNSVAAGPAGGYTNSAFAVAPAGSISRYDKIRLVPFGEYVPLWARWFFSDSLVHVVGDFTAGTEARPLAAGIPLGAVVCYEIVFPNLAARQVRGGAQVLATLTNDAWYGASWALDQHFAQAVLRAVETRRWVVRAALTGISGIIDPRGRVIHRLEAGETGVLVGIVRTSEVLTPSARFGDWWALLCLIAAIGGISGRMRPHRSAERRGREPVQGPTSGVG